jgi:ribonuclease HII
VDYSIVLVSHITIDEINILNAVRLGNKLCVEALKKTPEIVLIDGRDKQILTVRHETIIKGDAKVRCIAAASILAKVTRDKVMKKYAKEFSKYGFEEHMGYGTRAHRSNLIKFGRCEIHRKSYSFKAA